MLISKEEYEAETIYKLARLGLIDKDLFGYMARHLQKRSATAAYYLVFLAIRLPKLNLNKKRNIELNTLLQ